MFCKQCGNELVADAAVCMKCGVATGKPQNSEVKGAGNGRKVGMGILLGILALVVLASVANLFVEDKPREETAAFRREAREQMRQEGSPSRVGLRAGVKDVLAAREKGVTLSPLTESFIQKRAADFGYSADSDSFLFFREAYRAGVSE
jgi:hypothetical protein